MRVNKHTQTIVDAIFSGRETITLGEKVYYRKLFKSGTVRGFDIEGWRWIEQNPQTGSYYAEQAKAGKKIVWIINIETKEWKALIIDGKMHHKVNGRWEEIK
jgi:hypothetical protein